MTKRTDHLDTKNPGHIVYGETLLGMECAASACESAAKYAPTTPKRDDALRFARYLRNRVAWLRAHDIDGCWDPIRIPADLRYLADQHLRWIYPNGDTRPHHLPEPAPAFAGYLGGGGDPYDYVY